MGWGTFNLCTQKVETGESLGIRYQAGLKNPFQVSQSHKVSPCLENEKEKKRERKEEGREEGRGEGKKKN